MSEAEILEQPKKILIANHKKSLLNIIEGQEVLIKFASGEKQDKLKKKEWIASGEKQDKLKKGMDY